MFRYVRFGFGSVYSVCPTEIKPKRTKNTRTEQKTKVLKFYKNKSWFGLKSQFGSVQFWSVFQNQNQTENSVWLNWSEH